MSTIAPDSPAALRSARAENPKSRTRDLAQTLGVTEAHLVAAMVDGTAVVRIDPSLDRLFPAIETLGTVMALTRNDSCVIERDGTYLDYRSGQHAAMVLGPDIDMRMFPSHWAHGFAVTDGDKRSIQIFDAAGDAVHKVHLREASNVAAFDALVADLRLEDQSDQIDTIARAPTEAAKSNPEKLDILRKEWDGMTDTHQFMRLTSKLRMNRLGAYRIAGEPYAKSLKPEAFTEALHRSAAGQIPVMIFVGNRGCIEIHGGLIHRVEPMGPWINVLDPGFNLHLRADHIAEVWLVNKPTKQGPAISIEAFDAEGGLILQMFGKRDPDTDAWIAMTEALGAEMPAETGA
ncbi:hemin-degrading factor [Pararhodobacter zhoushanensis]|uniref:Hemin-degrading factor n=1 Tax=Pararhodobacter zhoushanensis TaxID=2479545 RepID=A0ABT3GWV4_9RHOB|nr:ChuX/HutX family heme-like substrate-binding protein [Pararhodobacter zhoushanensis]MCW1932036.1 hemin-degrading factor [Pararhodobacter zhoushanensis]